MRLRERHRTADYVMMMIQCIKCMSCDAVVRISLIKWSTVLDEKKYTEEDYVFNPVELKAERELLIYIKK